MLWRCVVGRLPMNIVQGIVGLFSVLGQTLGGELALEAAA